MTRRFPLLAAIPAAMLLAAPALAQDATSDVRCFVVANAFGNNGDDAHKALARAASIFYLGRSDTRVSAAQLKTLIVSQAKTLNQQNAGQIMTECARRFQLKQQQMAAIGKEIAAANPAPPGAAAPAPAAAAPTPPKK